MSPALRNHAAKRDKVVEIYPRPGNHHCPPARSPTAAGGSTSWPAHDSSGVDTPDDPWLHLSLVEECLELVRDALGVINLMIDIRLDCSA